MISLQFLPLEDNVQSAFIQESDVPRKALQRITEKKQPAQKFEHCDQYQHPANVIAHENLFCF